MNNVRVKLLFLILLVFSCFYTEKQAIAQTIIRDTEIENYLTEWFTPIFEANGMRPSQVNVVLVQSNEVNAFVAGGANIFFYTGLIELTDDPGELIGVMAHELGHITGGHLIRGREALEKASYESILGAILGLGAAVASGDAGAAAAGSSAGSHLAQRRFLSTARTYESSADQAAINSMRKAGLDPKGLLTFIEKLEGQELLPASQQSEYMRTHPLTRDRVDTMRAAVEKNESNKPNISSSWRDQHQRMKAKLLGFIHPEQVEWRYDMSDQSIPALYARSIAAYRQNNIDQALNVVEKLISKEPNNPYFHELKGQMLVEFGRVEEGMASYERALKKLPRNGLVRMALGQAQISSAGNDRKQLEMAITNLKRALQSEPRSTRIHRLLATAYGRLGQKEIAQLHLAEEALLQGRFSEAERRVRGAMETIENGSPDFIRAQDVLNAIQTSKQAAKNKG